MSPLQFKTWRKSLGLKQKEAAELLGLKKRMIQYYETGERGGKKVKIPKSVRLACYALSQGVEDFDGTTVATGEFSEVLAGLIADDAGGSQMAISNGAG